MSGRTRRGTVGRTEGRRTPRLSFALPWLLSMVAILIASIVGASRYSEDWGWGDGWRDPP